MYALILLALLVSCVSAQTQGRDIIVQQKLTTDNAPIQQVIQTQEADYNIGSTLNVVNRGTVGAPFDGQKLINDQKLVREVVINQAPTLQRVQSGNNVNHQKFIINAPSGQVFEEQKLISDQGAPLGQVQAFNRLRIGNTVDRRQFIIGAPSGQVFEEQKLINGQEALLSQAPNFNRIRIGNTVDRRQFIIGAPSGQLVQEQKLLRDDGIAQQLNQAPLLYRTPNVINRRGYIVAAPSIENVFQNQDYQQNKQNFQIAYQSAPWPQTELNTVRRVFQSPNIGALNRRTVAYSDFEKFGGQKLEV